LGRTIIYNTIDRLETKNLLIKNFNKNGHTYRASPPEMIKSWYEAKKKRFSDLEVGLNEMVNSLQNLGMPTEYKSKTEYFSGQSGIEQIFSNSTRARNNIFIYGESIILSDFVDKKTTENYRLNLVKNEITTHQLTNLEKINDFTKVQKMVADYWNISYLNPQIFKVRLEMMIYNDVCVFYSKKDGDYFGAEIHNQNLASMQKQIFKAMQKLAKPMIKLNEFGKAKKPSELNYLKTNKKN
jgi:hypothetical protein